MSHNWRQDWPSNQDHKSVSEVFSGVGSARNWGSVWHSSSKLSPCPLCRRDIDGKCRRSQGLIHCWPGERFGPLAGLRVGDVLEVEGQSWTCVSLRGGFSGAHVVLRPRMGWESFRPAVRAARRRQIATLEPVLLDLFRRFRVWVQAAPATRELQLLKPAEQLVLAALAGEVAA